MTSKKVREIEGYKFYSIAHESKEAAAAASKNHYSPVYDSITKAWYNMNTLAGIKYQEDFGVTPDGQEIK